MARGYELSRFGWPLTLSVALHVALLGGSVPWLRPDAGARKALTATITRTGEASPADKSEPPPTKLRRAAAAPLAPVTSDVFANARPAAAKAPQAEPAVLPDLAAAVPGGSEVPVFQPSPPVGVREPGPDPDGLAEYRLLLAREARRHKRYPLQARERGWQGTVGIVAVFGTGVRPIVSVDQSSGIPLLDQQALAMIERAVEAAEVPASLRGRSFRVAVPVRFGLED